MLSSSVFIAFLSVFDICAAASSNIFSIFLIRFVLDILVKENGKWNAYEVKSSLNISETYLMDSALQYYVLTNSDVEIIKFFLVHINPDYTFRDTLNIAELFNFVDVTDEAKKRQSYVGQQIEDEKQTLALKKSPPIEVGNHCNNPYPCDFIGHCWKHIPKKPVFDPTQLFDKENFNQIFQTLQAPVFFIAFLGYRKAVPEWENYKPYDIVPVSCTVKKPDADSSPYFVNTHPDKDSDGEFFEFLKTEIGSECSLITYDGERVLEFLTRMAERNPVIKNQLEAISGHVFDLKNLNKDIVKFQPKIESGNPLLSLQQLFAKAGSGASPFISDTLAINEYLQFASKKSKMKLTLETFYEYTNILADLTSEFYNYLNQKNLS